MGGALAAAGERVTFLVRPVAAKHLRSNGIRITGAMGSLRVPSPRVATDLPSTLSESPCDLIILTVKSFHTEAAIRSLQSAGPPTPPILCLQNGVDNEKLLADAFGQDRVIHGTMTTAVSSPETGTVMVERERGVGIGSGNPLSRRLLHTFSAAGFHTLLYPNPLAMKWSKLLTNLVANASAAICDISPAAVFAHDRLFQLEITALRETLAVMQRMNLPVVRLPGTPSHWLGFVLRRLPTWSYRSVMAHTVARGRGSKPPSLHVDLVAQRGRSEVDFLNGAVARHADTLGLAAPVNEGLAQLLGQLVSGETPWEHYRANPDRLADQLLSEKK